MVGMPKIATNPNQYVFWKPREYDNTHLMSTLKSLHDNSANSPIWSNLKNSLSFLDIFMGGTKATFDPNSTHSEEAVNKQISHVARSFLEHIGLKNSAGKNDLLYRDIHREVSFCSRPSAMSRLLLLYAGGFHEGNPMVGSYGHSLEHRPKKSGRRSLRPEKEKCNDPHLRFRPSTYQAMAACNALQHAITRNQDNDAKVMTGAIKNPEPFDIQTILDQGILMDKAATTFLDHFL